MKARSAHRGIAVATAVVAALMATGPAVGAGYDDAARTAIAEGSGADGGPAESAEARARRQQAELCFLMNAAADAHAVPRNFFIRLIHKESRFNPRAVSPVGAQGIAQFMPATARLRGLKNPFDPAEALFASASFLADLKARFGSWGLAAAGYNGGPGRVPRFVEGKIRLPRETVGYVYSITGRTVEHFGLRARRAAALTSLLPGEPQPAPAPAEAVPARPDAPWRRLGDLAPIEAAADRAHDTALTDGPPRQDARLPGPPRQRPEVGPPQIECPVLMARLGTARDLSPPAAGILLEGGTPWGAQVAGHPRRHVALRQYDRLKPRLPDDLLATGPRVVVRRFAARGRLPIHAVQFGAASRDAAEALCRRIAKARAPCVVVKNS
ncbi:MAG: lytic transglycosylase domain-containing protein [Acuticoccus sp.]